MTNIAVRNLLVSLADIARLADVQRPVVSMWRRRNAGTGHSFPNPVDVVRGEERFDAIQVVEHLVSTGRGNNPQVREDVAAFAELRAMCDLPETVVIDGLSSLLCLKQITGELLGEIPLTSLLGLVSDADSGDIFMGREIQALGADVSTLATHADALADACYTTAAAFELLLSRWVGRILPGFASVALRDDARRLVALAAKGLAQGAELTVPVFVDPTSGGSDLLLSVAALYDEGLPPSVRTGTDDSRAGRLARRRLRVHDIHRDALEIETDGSFQTSGEAVVVAQLPPPGRPAMSELELLTAVENIALQMDDGQRAVVIAPASVLTDRLTTSELDLARDATLRTGRVRAAIRLPQGLVVHSPRRAMAMWALGPAHRKVPVGNRWTVIADLSNRTLTAPVVTDLVTDMVASMGDEALIRAHAFRFARRVPTTQLLLGRRALVERVVREPRRSPSAGAELSLRIEQLTGSLEPTVLTGLAVDAAPATDDDLIERIAFTLEDAVRTRRCRILPGNRVDPADLSSTTGATVVGVPELIGDNPIGHRQVDRLNLGGTYPSARFTEPNDIVFCTSPRPAALVDEQGGSVVASPARVIRIKDTAPGGLIPQVLATDINALEPEAKHWRLWRLRRTPDNQREALEAALAEIEEARSAARRRLGDLDQLAAALTEGVTTERLTITRDASKPPDKPGEDGS